LTGVRVAAGVSVEALVGEEGDVVRERRFQALLAANLLAPLGITLVSPLLETLSGPFGVSPARMGLLVSAYTAPPVVLIPVAGVLADRVGRKPVLLSGILLFGAGGSAIALTTDFRVAVALRLLQGVAFAGLTTIIVTSIGDVYVGAREATAQGLRFTSSGVYQAVFPPVAGLLVVVAWWAPFLIYALAFPVAAVVYLWFDEPLERTAGADGPDAGVREVFGLVARPRVLALVVGRGLPMLPWVGFLTYNSLLVVRGTGGTPAEAGVLVAVNSVGLAVGGSQAGRITERFDSRLWPLAGANLLLAAGVSTVAFAPVLAVAVAGAAVLGLGFGVSLSLYRSVVTGLAPANLRGGLVSVSESGGRVASTVTPVAMGWVAAAAAPSLGLLGGVRLAAAGTGAVALVGGSLALAVARLSPPAPAER
jgi:MFS family permease